MVLENLAFVFVAGLLTALATGLGAIPFFLVEDVGDRWNVILRGLASVIVVSASVFGLLREGLVGDTGGSSGRDCSRGWSWSSSATGSSPTPRSTPGSTPRRTSGSWCSFWAS
jgi:zinc transporter ZupT